jgi:hypothetical protein
MDDTLPEDAGDRLKALEQALDQQKDLWLVLLRGLLPAVRRRLDASDLEPTKRLGLLAALKAAETSLGAPHPNRANFTEAGKTFARVLRDGNGVGSCEQFCAALYAECLAGGGDFDLCTVALFLCLWVCGQEAGVAKASSVPEGFLPFKGCRGFHENLTPEPRVVTVTLFNPGPGSMDISFQGADDVLTPPVTKVEEGEYKTITVTIPPGKRLHGNSDGFRRPER